MPTRLPTVACLIAFALAAACAADLDLVRDGAPVAEIVIPADAHESITMAAEELNLHLDLISGAKLPVVTQPTGDAPAVYLGAPDEAWAAAADAESLAFGGFVVECTASRLVLAGSVPEGTLNAVYWLLWG